ncbi:hypothetical protein V496_00356 [Pseudogymnoascus sp. VKM F-4515 (FW-2607)]|nr:hypothetical protein V496_00356 [Pseudogymnoascus sp. VKM F-4515 (FW-2607)]
MTVYQATVCGAQLLGPGKPEDVISDGWVLRKDEGSDQDPTDVTSIKDSGWILPIGDLEMSTKAIIGVIETELFSEMWKAAGDEKPLPTFWKAFCYIRQQIQQRIELSNSRTDYDQILQSATNPLTVLVLSEAISEAESGRY